MVIAPQRPNTNPRPWLDASIAPQIVVDGIHKRYGDFVAVEDVNLSIYRGEMFALVGASGCGKTTLLRMLAGFVTPTAGRILIDGVDMTDVPPYERPVNMMFQSYALFPHMTVEDNIAYGLKRDGIDRPECTRRVNEALQMLQLGGLGKRKPHQLSGGQRQRVALARAIVKRPKVLLLDEPLSALDKKLRESTQFELMDLQYELGMTFVVVTHDQDEAMALASRVAVMDRGHVLQVGTPAEVYEYPRSRFVADFFGTANLIEGTVESHQDGVLTVGTVAAGPLRAQEARVLAPGTAVTLAIRPEKMRLSKTPPADDLENSVSGEVWELGYLGNRSIYRIKTSDGQLLTVFSQNEKRTLDWAIDWGDRVHVHWSPEATAVLES
jgi:putrescine transport system ATP-binding protein